jgi:hypothetical protein
VYYTLKKAKEKHRRREESPGDVKILLAGVAALKEIEF